MKNIGKLSLMALILLSCVSFVLCQAQSHKIISIPFTSTGSYTFNTTASPMGLESIDMTFTGGPVADNTFTLSYVRSNVTHTLLVQSNAVMRTCIWLLPAQYFFQTGDRLTWGNTVASPAVLTVNGSFDTK